MVLVRQSSVAARMGRDGIRRRGGGGQETRSSDVTRWPRASNSCDQVNVDLFNEGHGVYASVVLWGLNVQAR